jgi:hypothetical protein
LAPIFDDGTFEYIPIPEGGNTAEDRTYAGLAARRRGVLADFLPSSLRDATPHLDPEFATFTYGDPTRNKRRQLAKLMPGDLLVFYAGLEPPNSVDASRLFFIAYFTIRNAYDFQAMPQPDRPEVLANVAGNAHVKRSPLDSDLVIVRGDRSRSRLLRRAVPLGGARDYILPELEPLIGKRGSSLRAIGRWVDEAHIAGLRAWIHHGPPLLVNDDSHLFSYVLASDSGFAPNVRGRYCTLACCKPSIRASARVGDWVIGTLPSRLGRHRLAYAMRINEALSFDAYHGDSRFACRLPDRDPHGDNIYYREDGRFRQLRSPHHGAAHLRHDTKTDRVLVGSLFWYFGDNAPPLPVQLRTEIVKKGPGHKRVTHTAALRNLVEWLSSSYRIGTHGRPRNRDKGD